MLKRILMGLFMMWVTLHLTGCDFIQSLPIPFLHKEEEAVEEEPEEEEPPAEHEALIDTKPKPVIDSYRPISVKMPDGLKIEGTLYVPGLSPYKAPVLSEESETAPVEEEEAEGGGGADPEGEEDAEKPKEEKEATPAKIQYPLVILFHGLSGDRWEWKEYPRHLVSAGYAVLAIDLRGHGESVYQGKHLRVWRQFDRSDWDKMAADTRNVLKYIAKQSKFNMVNTHKVGVVGASIGANIGLTFSHLDAKDVKATVLLSPGLEYQGIKTEEVMKHFKTPVYLLASTEDAYAADSTEQLYKTALGRKKIKIFQDLGHGIDMLNNDPELGRDILDWLKLQLPPTGIASSEPAAPVEGEAAEEPKDAVEPAKPEPKKPEAPKAAKPTPPAKPAAAKPKAAPAPAKAAKPAPAASKPEAAAPTPKPEAKPAAEPVKKPAPTPTAKPAAPATPPPAAPTPVTPTPAPPTPAPIPGGQ